MNPQYEPTNVPSSNDMATTTEADERKKMGRRALIAAAGLGVVGLGVAEAPNVVKGVGDLTQQQLQNAIAYGRQQLAKELITVEEIGIDIAVDVSNITHGAVQLFVIPIANLLAGLTEITLDVARGAVDKARGLSGLLGIDISALGNLSTILGQWKANVALFPVAVNTINNVDTKAANTYLTGLKTKLEREAASK